MLTEVTINKEGKRELVFSGDDKIELSQGMDVDALNSAASLISADANREIFLHDNAAGSVDVHIRYDGNRAPDKWWEQPSDGAGVAPGEAGGG